MEPVSAQPWKDGTWFLLPNAANLRALALQDPIGTTILRVITTVARNSILSDLCAQPQFAYLPNRGTFEAISRATAHCRNVRDALFRFRRSHEVRSKNELDSLPRPDLFRTFMI